MLIDSYYTVVHGKKYDKKLVELATFFIVGQGDGRISKTEMHLLFEAVQDANRVTPIEKETLVYIKDSYNCTPSAISYFNKRFTEL